MKENDGVVCDDGSGNSVEVIDDVAYVTVNHDEYAFPLRDIFRMILSAALGNTVVFGIVDTELDSFEEDLELDAHGSYGGTD